MLARRVISSLLVVLAALAGDPVPWFARLESAEWAERELAQRRLGAELSPDDARIVRDALVAGGAETRLRLAHVLADEDRLFGVAAELAVDADEHVARAGTTALRLAIDRYEPYASSAPIPRDRLWTALSEHDGAPVDARSPRRFEPDEVADLLVLAQTDAPRIVFDVEPRTSPSARRPVEYGAWREIARGVAQQVGGRLVGYGVEREPAPHAVRWLAVVARDAEDERAGELVERWCRAYARAGDEARRSAASSALCAHGLPPAVAWIARRFRATRDGAAFDGLALAARRGRVDAVLQEPFARAHAWDALERGGDGPRALHAALVLARVGPPADEAELARALAHLDPSSPARAELTLVVLEGWASARAPRAFVDAVRGLLARADLATALRFQASRVAARLGVAEPLAGDVGEFARAVLAAGHGDEFARLARGAAGWPPDAWADDERLAPALRDPDVRVVLVDAWLARGAIDPAARAIAQLLASAPRASAGLRAIVAPDLRAAVERAANGLGADERAARLVACGVATDGERANALAAYVARAPASEIEWLALADLCAGATADAARARLLALFAETTPEIALLAASRAVHALRAELDDPAERAFLQAVRGVVRADRGGPLDRAFRADAWPPPPSVRATALRALDRDPSWSPR